LYALDTKDWMTLIFYEKLL